MSEVLRPEHYEAILKGLPNGVYVVDAGRKILFWNEGAERITGYLAQEVIGRNCNDNLLAHCDRNFTLLCDGNCPLKGAIEDGRPREASLYLRHKKGSRVPVNVRAVPIRDANGVIIGAAETFDESGDTAVLNPRVNAQAVRNRNNERTGVWEESFTRRYLKACLRDYEESGIPFGLLLIAVDDLSPFRQSYGGQAVLKMLETVGETMARSLREDDIIGDWTGNRFLALMVNCPAENLARVTLRLKRMAGMAEMAWWGERLSVTVSIGGAAVAANDTVDSLLARSETALRACACKGGNGEELL